jgi:hypothetical protein
LNTAGARPSSDRGDAAMRRCGDAAMRRCGDAAAARPPAAAGNFSALPGR